MKTDYLIKRTILYITMAFAMAIQWTQLNAQNPVRVYSDLTETTLVSDHSNIQAAIDAATTLAGYVVRVDAGTYIENISVNGKNLVFRGANSGLNNVNSPRGPETIINAATNAPLLTLEANVTSYTIDGFKLVGADYNDGTNGRIIWAKNQTGSHNIINNVLELTSSQVNTKRYIWIGFSNSVNTGANYVSGSISHNLFEAIGAGSGFNGITVQQCSQNFHITGNRFVGMKGQRNILIWHPSVTTVIENNELARTDPFGDLVWFGGPGAHGAGLAGAVVRNNKFTCSNLALGFFNMDYNAAISNNDFSAVDGLAIEVTSGSGIADATCNWFGSNVVPSTKVAGNINVAPWLVSGVNTSPSVVGFTPQTGVCVGFPVQVKDGLTMAIKSGYATIQAAINAADPGDIVSVSPGSYNEDLTISKSINLEGPNVGIKGDGTSRTAEAQLLNGRITISGTHTVVVDGMQIYTTTNSSVDLILINSTSATVTIKNNRIERFGTTGGVLARGVVTAIGITTPVVIEDNYFTGDAAGGLFSGHLTLNNGIFCNGGSNILIKGNKFDITRTAINVDNMSAGVTITENIFENNGSALAFGGTTATTGSYTISGNSFKVFGTIANLSNVTTAFRLDLTGNTFDGKPTSALDLVESFNIERTLFHRGRSSRNGAVTFVPNKQLVVAQNPSIQTAITYSNSGDEVLVEAGTYTENLLIDKTGLTILGPNSNLAGNDNARSPEAILQGVARVEANDVTIKGFSIDGTTVTQSTNLVMRGILVANTAARSGVTIENNIIQNWVTGISLAGGGTPGWVNHATIKGNLLVNNSIGSTENATNLTIIHNSFDNGGIGLGGGATLSVPITGNTFANGASRYVAAASSVVADFGDILTNNTFDKAALVSAATGSWFERAIFASIQPALDASATGATISVAAGTYIENVIVNKSVKVRGPNYDKAYDDNTRASEALIDGNIEITAVDATFSGFEINRSFLPSLNWLMQVSGAGATISNNIIKIGTVQTSTVSGLIRLNTTDTNAVIFIGNELKMATPGSFLANTGINGLLTQGSGTYTITGNRFAVSGGPTTDADAVGITGGTVLFDGNLVDGDIMGGVTAYGNFGNVTISNNQISNYTDQLAGIRVVNCCGFDPATGFVTITGNTVGSTVSGTTGVGIIGVPAANILSLTNNDLSGNATAMNFTGTGTLPSTCNWWGQATGPDTNQVIGEVLTAPFLLSDDLITPDCTGYAPGTVFQRDADGNIINFFTGSDPIASAISAVGNDTVNNIVNITGGEYIVPINATGNPDPAVTISIGTSPGCVTVTDLILSGNDTYLQDIFGSTACTQYDQLTVSSNVALGGANLVVVLDANYLPVNGAQFTIIDNTGSDPISGTFAQGNYIALGTVGFEINYQGGDGNDVVLTYCGGVLNVNTNERFCELQSAINASTTLDGHVLELEAGNYFGNGFSVGEIIVSKELTIKGSNFGKAGSDITRVSESQLFGFFKLLRNNVTIDGLTIKSIGAALTNDKTNAFQVYAGGLLGSPAATSWFNNIVFTNNIVSDKDGTSPVVSLDKSSNPNQLSLTTTNWEVSNNRFNNFVGTAGNTVISISGVDSVKVNGNAINYNAANGANALSGRIGVKVQMVGTARVEINDNVISLNADVSDPASRDAALAEAPFGIQILGSTKNFEVLRNTIDKAAAGISINSSPSTGTSLVENATVSNNAITNANTGIRFNAGSFKDILGQGNVIDAFKSALVMDADAGTYVNIAFIENSLLSGAGFFGIQALTSSTVSPKVLSRCNWYGVADFAGVTDRNDGPNTIDFTQFATDGDLSVLKCGKVLQLAALLEGPFDVNTGEMRTDLNIPQIPVLPILPSIPSVLESHALIQPYGTPLFGNYSGTETTTANYLSDNDSIVDWILIETRDAADRLTILERKAAFICEGGTVISHNGLPIVMETGGSATFHIALLHRNHANVATKDPVPGNWDIRFSSSNVFVQTVSVGGIPEPRKTLKSAGVFKLLYAGDSNNDNNITTLDFDAWIQRAGQNGYFLGDFDLSGNVTTTDTDLPIRNAGEGISFPQP